MKRIILAVIGSLLLGTSLSPQAFSVVPYPLSSEEAGQISQEGVARSTSPRNVGQVADKLAEDQRRLESVLEDIKEDQKVLKQTSSSSREDPDGYSVR